VLLPVALIFGVPIRKFVMAVKEPAIIAFSTTSSEAALPRAMEVIERLGVPRRIVAFVLPLGYSFNLDGTTLYCRLRLFFVAQAAGVHLSAGRQVTMLLTLMLTARREAGVPRASLVILAATLASYVTARGRDAHPRRRRAMDMARTLVNVIGNCLATVVVAKWEESLSKRAIVICRRRRPRRDLIRHMAFGLPARHQRRSVCTSSRALETSRALTHSTFTPPRGGRSCASRASTISRRSGTNPGSRSSRPAYSHP
jgi:Na+/H+-dicarboxylate symporter